MQLYNNDMIADESDANGNNEADAIVAPEKIFIEGEEISITWVNEAEERPEEAANNDGPSESEISSTNDSDKSAGYNIEWAWGSSGVFEGSLMRKPIPADNSCLFSSVRFALNGEMEQPTCTQMRRTVAEEIAADPITYNDAVLGKPIEEYCDWIQRPVSWGGAIELAVLSNFYNIEIDVIDIHNAIINRFGEDRNFGLRVFLLYDGSHYDALYMETEDGATPATMFPTDEWSVYYQAEQVATDKNHIVRLPIVEEHTIRCLICDQILLGVTEAALHAKNTFHIQFSRIPDKQ